MGTELPSKHYMRMMMIEPSMIDMMDEVELRQSCTELSIDCERERKRIAKLEDALKYYASPAPWNRRSNDFGYRARQALQEKDDE